jgi:hypothetical protein
MRQTRSITGPRENGASLSCAITIPSVLSPGCSSVYSPMSPAPRCARQPPDKSEELGKIFCPHPSTVAASVLVKTEGRR